MSSSNDNPKQHRQEGARQAPSERITNFREVAGGYSPQEAGQEAARCLGCKNAKCTAACPVNVKIPEFIALIKSGKPEEAVAKIMETNLLPAICGRVCPQENHCEGACVLGKKFSPIAIGMLERFAADASRAAGKLKTPQCAPPTGFKVAAVGSGPSALALAAELARLGHAVTVFEGLHDFGGVLRYGIPSFRLNRKVIDAEIETVRAMGVKFVTDTLIGSSVTMAELLAEYDAVYVGSGAGSPSPLNVPGENLVGVYSANEFLTRINLMGADKFPETDTPVLMGRHVIVVGGGNSAMDSARCAKRFSPESVTVMYRRSRSEMPARREEADNALEEGIKFEFLAAPIALESDETGRVKAARCVRMQLGEPDASGRRKPVVIPGSEFTLEADTVIVAIGQKPNPIIQKTTAGLSTGKNGAVITDETGKTSLPKVFAGGDIIRGGATVLLAMKDGKAAAAAIHRELCAKK